MFVNGMWLCESSLAPHQMLSLLQSLEQGAGRERLIHWGPTYIGFRYYFSF
ncbi:MAG: 2-amino-4-hydroxy-6-hydroxymethyldihydropteridine diphosphokinase [Veillonella sp.]